jgi:LmbE family N-acetylglucosaminyl deacetylase
MVIHEAAGAKIRHQKYYRHALEGKHNRSRVAWMHVHSMWLGFVESLVSAFKCASDLALGPQKYSISAAKSGRHGRRRATVLMCSPHPDDEALVGGFALRALQESNARVVNCAITLGADTKRKQERLRELGASCAVLGFELKIPGWPKKLGLEHVKPQVAKNNPKMWRSNHALLKSVFEYIKPDVVLMPHAGDFHSTHKATHQLAVEVAAEYSRRVRGKRLLLLETEYWHPMEKPNLMVGITSANVAILIMAVAEHGGEVRRNPYHLRHPARMMDNVRRGSEVIKGEGASAEEFMFAELYRLSAMTNGAEENTQKWKIIPPDRPLKIGELYELFQ